ncbi:hypothetical protein HDV00_006817 [Rhizophlyctis rosea]|nr:hypothetical protein HDV00_006817 [Rhizophlyctis rosea]
MSTHANSEGREKVINPNFASEASLNADAQRHSSRLDHGNLQGQAPNAVHPPKDEHDRNARLAKQPQAGGDVVGEPVGGWGHGASGGSSAS